MSLSLKKRQPQMPEQAAASVPADSQKLSNLAVLLDTIGTVVPSDQHGKLSIFGFATQVFGIEYRCPTAFISGYRAL